MLSKPVLNRNDEKDSISKRNSKIVQLFLFFLILIFFFSSNLLLLSFIFVVLTVHELGHYLLWKKSNYFSMSIFIVPSFDSLLEKRKKFVYETSQTKRLWILIAGPLPGILIGLILCTIGYLNNEKISFNLGFIFLIFNSFNLLPIIPLDGGRMLDIITGYKAWWFHIVCTMFFSLVFAFFAFYFSYYPLLILVVLSIFQFRNIHRRKLIYNAFDQEELNYFSSYSNLSDRDFFQMKPLIIENTWGLKSIEQNAEYEETNDLISAYLNSILLQPMKLDLSWKMKFLVFFLWISILTSAITAFIYFDLIAALWTL